MAATGASGPLPQQGPASPDLRSSGVSSEGGDTNSFAAVPRLLQSLVPPAVIKWLREEAGGGGCASDVGAEDVPWVEVLGEHLSDDSDEDVRDEINPLFPLQGTVDAQLSLLGGEAWEDLRPPAKDGALGALHGGPEEGGDLSLLPRERGGSRLSLGESRALLEALLPLAAQRVSDTAVSLEEEDRQPQEQQEPSSSLGIGIFSLVPQPTGGAADGLQQWLSASEKAGGPLVCGPLLGALQGVSGLSSGLDPSSEVQCRRLRRRRQILLRQLLKSRALLLQLSQQAEGGHPATVPAAAAGGETQEQQEMLRQRIRTELRRAAMAAYNLSCCCFQETAARPLATSEGPQPAEGIEIKAAPDPAAAAAAATQQQQRQEQKFSTAAAAAAAAGDGGPYSPELLLPLAALPCGVVLCPPGTEEDLGDPEGPSPPPPPSPVSWPMAGDGPLDGEAPEGVPQVARAHLPGAPWVLEEIAFDGRRSCFLVTLNKAATEARCSSSNSSRGGGLRRTKVFSCLCRSRDNTAAVAAKYAELRQRVSLSSEETAAAQTLSDEGETEGEADCGPATSLTAAAGRRRYSSHKGIDRLLQEVGEGLQLLLLRRQRLALQQQGTRLYAAASHGCWFDAETMVSGAPYPLNEPPWRYRLAPAPPGVQVCEGPSDAPDEVRTPRAAGLSILPGTTKGGPHKGKGGSKLAGPFTSGGGPFGGPFNPYGGGAEDEDSISLMGGRKGSNATAAAAAAADGDSTGPFSLGTTEQEELPFAGDPPDAKPWSRPPVSRAPYTCFSLEAPIGGGTSQGGGGGPHGQVEGVSDNPTPDTESAEAPWGDPAAETAGEEALTAATTVGPAGGEGFGADGAAPVGSKPGELTGASRGVGGPESMSWALRVTQRQKGDSWQLRMVRP